MIIYDTNKNWFRDIRHLSKSWTMIKILRASLAVGVYTFLVSLVHLEFFPDAQRMQAGQVFTFLGVVLSILLVFRTNSAYDRWWEGRKQWGALVNNCRNLALYSNIHLPISDSRTRAYLAKNISNFCISMVEHLRHGTKLENLRMLTPDEKMDLLKVDHVPNKIAMDIWCCLHTQYRKGNITEMDILNLRPAHQSLLDILGACERIRKTPIPFSYAIFLKIFITAYALILPFAVVDQMGYWSVLAVTFVFFAFIAIEMLGEEIEDPFGTDCNDLPTLTIAETIAKNVHELLQVSENEPVKERELYSKVF